MAILIGGSVGRGGVNAPVDVAAIGGALVAVGVQNGGMFAVPLELDWLGDAIAGFQRVQGLMANPDGRVDPGGNTLRRINAILSPDEVGIGPLVDAAGLTTSVNATFWTPVEASLSSDFVFQWTRDIGRGQIRYFQLGEAVVPRWFGVLIPDGPLNFDQIHIFFHPTPAQPAGGRLVGHDDAEYQTLGNFKDIFHYLSETMGAQFCAAQTGRIMVMPLMTQASEADCGIFPQRWVDIVGCILGRILLGLDSGAPFQAVTSVVVSSFSSGIVYSHQFRARANLGPRLAGVIDFDGITSSYSYLSLAVTEPVGHVIRAQQSDATAASVPGLAARNIFPLRRPRWGDPWVGSFDPDPMTALLQIHGQIPQTMMQLAAKRAG